MLKLIFQIYLPQKSINICGFVNFYVKSLLTKYMILYCIAFWQVKCKSARQCVYRTANSEHCFDLSGLISSAVGETDIYSRQYTPEKELFARGLQLYASNQNLQKNSLPNPYFAREKAGHKAGNVSVRAAKKK